MAYLTAYFVSSLIVFFSFIYATDSRLFLRKHESRNRRATASEGVNIGRITATDITAGGISASSIKAKNVNADKIKAKNIKADYIRVTKTKKSKLDRNLDYEAENTLIQEEPVALSLDNGKTLIPITLQPIRNKQESEMPTESVIPPVDMGKTLIPTTVSPVGNGQESVIQSKPPLDNRQTFVIPTVPQRVNSQAQTEAPFVNGKQLVTPTVPPGMNELEGLLKARLVESKHIDTNFIKANQIKAEKIHAKVVNTDSIDLNTNKNRDDKNALEVVNNKSNTKLSESNRPKLQEEEIKSMKKRKRRKRPENRRKKSESLVPTKPPEMVGINKRELGDSTIFKDYHGPSVPNIVQGQSNEQNFGHTNEDNKNGGIVNGFDSNLATLMFLGLSDDYVKNLQTEKQLVKVHPTVRTKNKVVKALHGVKREKQEVRREYPTVKSSRKRSKSKNISQKWIRRDFFL